MRAGEMDGLIRDMLRERRIVPAFDRARADGGRSAGEARHKPFGERAPAAVATDEEGQALGMNDALRATRDDPRGRTMNEIIRGEGRG